MVINEAERWLAGQEYSVVSRQVPSLASRSGCSTYDCEFVALAQDLNVLLVTTDRLVLKAFPAIATTPASYVE